MVQRCQPAKKLGILRGPSTSAMQSHCATHATCMATDGLSNRCSLAHLGDAARQALEHVVMGVDKPWNDHMV